MRSLTSAFVLLLLLPNCSLLEPEKFRKESSLAHPYLSFPQTQKEIKNLNPDSDGDPWLAGGLILPTEEEFEAVPRLTLPSDRLGIWDPMPDLVDNSAKKYFRGIFSQKNGSCAQASGIAYVYGYEVNRMRDADANDPENRFPTHWTYNFVNQGYDRGSWMMWGWEVGKSLGIPNVKVYGTETGFDLKHWPSEYAVYENAMESKVDKYFLMSAGTKATLEQVKRYIWNRGANGAEGSIVSLAAGWSTGYAEAVIPEGQYGAGEKLVKSFGKSVNHAVTFVGYDDKICYDFDEDGTCSNDKDLNGDDKIDLKDWEIGAFIMANSWGTKWGNQGFIYVPYRLCGLNPADGGIYKRSVYTVSPKVDEDKTLALRVTMQHDKRNELGILSSYLKNKNQRQYYTYYGLQNSGGSNPLNGKDGAPVAFGLDLRPLLPQENMKKSLDLGAVVDSIGGGVGKILKTEVVDYMNGVVIDSGVEDLEIEKGRNIVEAEWDPDDPDPDPDPDPEPEPPKPCQMGPVAITGHDLVVGEYCVLVLDGSKSYDVDGKIVKYAWKQISGPQKLKIDNANTARPVVFVPEVRKDEAYVLELDVGDDDGFMASDKIQIRVIDRVL